MRRFLTFLLVAVCITGMLGCTNAIPKKKVDTIKPMVVQTVQRTHFEQGLPKTNSTPSIVIPKTELPRGGELLIQKTQKKRTPRVTPPVTSQKVTNNQEHVFASLPPNSPITVTLQYDVKNTNEAIAIVKTVATGQPTFWHQVAINYTSIVGTSLVAILLYCQRERMYRFCRWIKALMLRIWNGPRAEGQ